MGQDFRCRLVNEFGDVLKINLAESHPAWGDMFNTLCGAHPVEWIGSNSHDKVFQLTPELKKRVFLICATNKNARPNLDDVGRYFNDQPDGSFISFLREGVGLGIADNRNEEALIKALAANYISERSVGICNEIGCMVENQKELKTLFCIASEGETWTHDLPRNFPEERRIVLFKLLRVATDMSMTAMRDGNNLWRLSDLRKHVKSQSVTESKVRSLVASLVNRLNDLEDEDVVVFGVLQSANETQLTNIVRACIATKLKGSPKQVYDRMMARERVFSRDGYKHKCFTDYGFCFTIAGKRVCRFCERRPADGATFKNEPHAISYFWGNHNLLGAGECDVCNGKFGKTLETQALRYYLPTLINCGVTGRGKDPKAFGENFALSLGKTQILSMENDNSWERLCNGVEVPHELKDNMPVVKADIYRCFCKYVVSLISDEELPDFKETVRWIMKERLSDKSMPPTLRNEKDLDLAPKPIIEIFTREASKGSTKTYIIAFRFITNLWLFAVPYVSGCENPELKHELLEFQKKFFSHLDFVQEDFSDENESYTTTHFSLSISRDTKMKRVCDMTPEEQDEFYSHMPKQWGGINRKMNQK